jgi:hypothetical protein
VNSRHIVRWITIVVFILLFVPSVPARNALLPSKIERRIDPQLGRRHPQLSPQEQQLERDRARAMNKERQEKLKQDTDKLLQLATELKQYVDKTNENILSIDVVKKTDEIEKLAKSIRDKMKTAYDVPQEPGSRPR